MPSSRNDSAPAVVYPRGNVPGRLERFAPALIPLSWLYRLGVRVAAGASGQGASRASGTPWTISVGNIEVGGSGKTPVALRLIEHIRSRGDRPVYVSRGYRSRAARAEGVTVVVPAGRVGNPLPGVRLVRRDDPGLAREIGDEGAVVAWREPEVPLLLGRNKRHSLDIAARMFAPSHVVLDDAFQSWSIYRDCDVVVLSDSAPGARRLPAGPLREGLSALSRAHVVLLADNGDAEHFKRQAERLRPHLGQGATLAGLRRLLRFSPDPPTGPVAAVSSIGRPGGFDVALASAGVDARVSIRFPDHHTYTDADLQEVARVARAHGAQSVVVTEKDAVKLSALEGGELPIVVARLEVKLSDERLLDKIVEPRHRAAAPQEPGG